MNLDFEEAHQLLYSIVQFSGTDRNIKWPLWKDPGKLSLRNSVPTNSSTKCSTLESVSSQGTLKGCRRKTLMRDSSSYPRGNSKHCTFSEVLCVLEMIKPNHLGNFVSNILRNITGSSSCITSSGREDTLLRWFFRHNQHVRQKEILALPTHPLYIPKRASSLTTNGKFVLESLRTRASLQSCTQKISFAPQSDFIETLPYKVRNAHSAAHSVRHQFQAGRQGRQISYYWKQARECAQTKNDPPHTETLYHGESLYFDIVCRDGTAEL